ncbi:MAG: prepilin-type N-terminal cleavage/methylation domain-containing protein [Candidatus Riflebacteria bacterium]|nr:prepilin-type N-terminal cleavage/methylation domain-containing protein [Candidatus Riflebacteria bacterium]
MRKKQGVTLIEVMIGFILVSILGLSIYHFMSGARRLSSMAATKGMLRQEALLILKHMERDISNSRAEIVEENGKNLVKKTMQGTNGNFTMEVSENAADENETMFDQNTDNEDATYISVEYQQQGTEFFRICRGKRRCLSRHLKEAKFEETTDGKVEETYDGKIKLLVILEAFPAGSSEKIEHVERAIIAVRQAQKKEADKRWKQRIDGSDANSY